jgi:copper chaperone NosL
MKKISRIIVFLCALAIIPSNYMSVWQIQLEAPQYPEGLKMEIWSHKIGGDIHSINNLNHYIGMSVIKEKNFKEFKVMPYLIWAMVGLGLLVALAGKKWLLYAYSAYFILCGAWGIYDFWQWEYEYGHNLNPHAAIKLPGMTYQPPLIGWKQLLNFLAGSFPDIGGWLIIGPAVVIVGVCMLEYFYYKRPTSSLR